MQIQRATADHEPVILLDPHIDSAAELAIHLELNGFPALIAARASAAQAVIDRAHFTTLIVIADFEVAACLGWLDELRRTAGRCWMIVVSPQCDTNTCNLIYRHGGDACMTAPVSIDDLTARLTTFQLHARPML
jgi:DNA-binding response OmpR family regulator